MASADPVILPEPIGARMKRARRRAGLSVDFMAEHFNKSTAAIRSWEQSLHQPHKMFEILEDWARLTDVSYTWLLTGSGTILTYSDALAVVDQGQLILPFDLPPASRTADLALVSGL